MTRVILAVDDVPRAVRFYRQAFAWAQEVDAPNYAEFRLPNGLHLGLYERDGFALNVNEPPFPIPAGTLCPTELYVDVSDVSAAIAQVERAGARLLSPLSPRDWGDEVAYFSDPDGNVLALARRLHG